MPRGRDPLPLSGGFGGIGGGSAGSVAERCRRACTPAARATGTGAGAAKPMRVEDFAKKQAGTRRQGARRQPRGDRPSGR